MFERGQLDVYLTPASIGLELHIESTGTVSAVS